MSVFGSCYSISCIPIFLPILLAIEIMLCVVKYKYKDQNIYFSLEK